MKKIALCVFLVSVLTLTAGLPQAAAQVTNGTHQLNYQVNQPNSNSASIANDYFVKPATVTVENGKGVVQLTLKNSEWITKFEPPGGAKIINEDLKADTRLVEFTVEDVSKPTNIKMKVDVEDINYHHEYTVSLVFDGVTPPAPKPNKPAPPVNSNTNSNTNTGTTGTNTPQNNQVKNPQTSDPVPYAVLLALAGSAYLLYRTNAKRKQGEQ